MSAVPAMLAMFYGALPPEVNTARLMAGAGEAPMYQAAAGWETLAISLETQAEELAGSLAALTSTWSGAASEQAVSSTTPMVVWLRTTALQAQKRAMQAIAQANSYMLAMATTPPIPEIEMNHVTHAVLEATNFMGVNTMPIGINEEDYFVRMWDQAAMAMHGYQAETSANTVFEPILPMIPIVVPGVGEAGAETAMGQIAALSMGAALRETAFAHVTAQATVESAGLLTGNMVSQANMAEQRGQGAAQQGQQAAQQAGQQQDKPQQGAQMAMQMATQVGSQVAQLPQQLGQLVMQPMQQLTQPLQQMTSIFGQMGGAHQAQIGLIGASPLSNHPLVGGSGASVGSGLVRAASLPGAGGSMARTPLMSSLIAEKKVDVDVDAMPVAAGAAAGSGGAGLAPVGGGGSPMGMMGQNGKSGGSKPGLRMPTLLPQDLGEDEADDW
jgi:PPE-repeat protein